MIIDIHFHLLAADDSPGCNLSKKARFAPAGWVAGALLGTLDDEILELIHPSGNHLTTKEICDRLTREIDTARHIDGAVLLALDCIVDEHGNELSTDVCVSEEVTWAMCRDHASPKRLLLGTSVHPNRKDALARLARAKEERNAVLVKWVPSSHRIDPASSSYATYYKELARLKLPLLCHCGPESALPDAARDERLNDPRRLVPALDAGVTVIVAHCAAHFLPRPLQGKHEAEYAPVLRSMLQDADRLGWNLYADISACLISPYRAARVAEVLDAVPSSRFVYGSDFPIFTHDLSLGSFGRPLSVEFASAALRAKNLLDKDVLSKRAVGVPASVFTNTAVLLGLAPGPMA